MIYDQFKPHKPVRQTLEDDQARNEANGKVAAEGGDVQCFNLKANSFLDTFAEYFRNDFSVVYLSLDEMCIYDGNCYQGNTQTAQFSTEMNPRNTQIDRILLIFGVTRFTFKKKLLRFKN